MRLHIGLGRVVWRVRVRLGWVMLVRFHGARDYRIRDARQPRANEIAHSEAFVQ